MSELLTIAKAAELSEPEVHGVLRLVADAETVDEVRTLNEAALLRLRRPHPTTQHLLVSEGANLVAYAQLESGSEWSAGQLLVAPEHRRQGIGTLLLQRLLMESSRPLRVWAMGDSSCRTGPRQNYRDDPPARVADHGTRARCGVAGARGPGRRRDPDFRTRSG